MWSQLIVVAASHYEAVRCAELKKAAMIILILRVRQLATSREWLRSKKSNVLNNISTINSRACSTDQSWDLFVSALTKKCDKTFWVQNLGLNHLSIKIVVWWVFLNKKPVSILYFVLFKTPLTL